MANFQDLLLQQVKKAAGNVEIPANVQNTVLNGLTDSIFGSLTQTAMKAGGIDQITSLLTGKANAATSPVTALAGKLFTNNILSKLNLGSILNGKLAALIPTVIAGLSSIIKDQDGDGDIDLQDVLITIKGGNKGGSRGGGLLGGILGGILGRK
ncbi:MAG: hypothetical protein IKI13_05230 [Bacteroidales bacterium]|jgi:hypothetical protein|nr:hypothetical protein [Bacteroidales bacterium]